MSEDGLFEDEDSIFHFTGFATGFEDILGTGKLKLGLFKDTNDPLEYKHRFIGYDINGNETEDSENTLLEAKDIVEYKLLNDSCFLSTCKNKISTSKRDFGYSKLRMWSQYGELHDGLCFVLSKSKLKKEIQKRLNSNQYIVYHGNVSYSYKYESVYQNSIFHYTAIGNKRPEDVALEYIVTEHKRLFFKKYVDYRDENEYRFVVINKNCEKSDVTINLASVMKGVIIGEHQNLNYIGAYDHYQRRYDHVVFCKIIWNGGRIYLNRLIPPLK